MANPVFTTLPFPITNPFGLTDVGGNASPTLADIDGDGDQDAFVGNIYGHMLFYRNIGSASSPKFTSPKTNPFGLTSVGYDASPSFADIDGDGDLDVFIGNSYGDTLFFRNIGTANKPKFTSPETNPFGLTNVGYGACPSFADIDGDGDLDVFIGNSHGDTLFFRNIGTANSPKFAEPKTNPFGLTDVGRSAAPTFVDIDKDGDLDAFVGEWYGTTLFFRNKGSASSPKFVAPKTNPFGLTDVGFGASPNFVDIDNDGDFEAFVGNDFTGGDTLFYAIDINPSLTNSFGLTSIGSDTTSPILVDIDDDGDLDAFVGNVYGNTYFYRNTGTVSNPKFADPETNPFGLTNVDLWASPTFGDIDNDGDLDAFIGNSDGDTLFFRNIGTNRTPEFAERKTNPFGLTTVGRSATPTFVDIDNDGDLDVFVGEFYGDTLFYLNKGSASNPKFAAPKTNPFGLTDVSYLDPQVLTFVDIDNDGDLDMLRGKLFFRNLGTASSPKFADPETNPFFQSYTTPSFADIDGDGDLDAFVGNSDGETRIFLNTLQPSVDGSSDNDALVGTGGNDVLSGLAGMDTLTGAAGHDQLFGDQGNDLLKGNADNDTIYGGKGDDLLRGGNGNDLLIGDAGNDSLSGGAGDDRLQGGTGNDMLTGGTGTNELTGGAGLDNFIFTTKLVNSLVRIVDFTVADDTIMLDNQVFNALTSSGVLAPSQFVIGTAAVDADDFIIYNGSTGALFYDADGNKAGEAVQIATLGVNLALTNADFVVV